MLLVQQRQQASKPIGEISTETWICLVMSFYFFTRIPVFLSSEGHQLLVSAEHKGFGFSRPPPPPAFCSSMPRHHRLVASPVRRPVGFAWLFFGFAVFRGGSETPRECQCGFPNRREVSQPVIFRRRSVRAMWRFCMGDVVNG